MITGMLGTIVFSCSDSFVKTFDAYTRQTAPRLATHEIIGKKPLYEYLGPGTDSITFTIKLSAYFGVSPKNEAKKLRQLCQKAIPVIWIMALAPVSENRWIIESMQETANHYDNLGNIVSSDISLTLKEYPADLAEEVLMNAGNS